jgi:prepilin-type N-terminal cleavage/methylation domain-containing protein
MEVDRPSRGFTIIELLAVISIIGILASMIFPVFARAREQARSTVCADNLHEIGMALQMYAGDWDGRYPPQEDNLAPIARRMGQYRNLRCPSALYSGLTKKDLARLAKAKHIEYVNPDMRGGGQPYSGERWTPVIADGVLLGADYYYHAGWTNEASGNALLAAEREASHIGRAHVLYASGRVGSLPEAEWKTLIPRSAQRRAEDFPSDEGSTGATPGRGVGLRGGMGRGMRGRGMGRGGLR